MEETKPVCPRCGSTCVVEMSNAKTCNQCGNRWDQVKDPISERARKARADAVGWPVHPERNLSR
jgi:tRNA(Ile2) C34 agmatinyltransferase TiaS